MNDCILMAIDSSTSCSGISIWKNGQLAQTITISNNKIKDNRLKKMVEDIYMVIKMQKPDIIVTETTAVGRNEQTQRQLTYLLGAIYGKCVDQNIFYYSYRPSEWRSKIETTIKPLVKNRNGWKRWALDVVAEKYNKTNIVDDVAEAILIGEAYVKDFSN